MAKPVSGLCNLDCTYCYYTAKPRELYGQVSRPWMTEEVLESYTRQYLSAMPVRTEFGWQGGEPLLRGKDFFRKAVAFQKQFARPGQVVGNAMQTNGVLIDDEWCEMFAEYNFLVGISLDGPPQWHDAFRRDRTGGPTFHRAWAGLELLRKHHVEFNVLATLNSANIAHAGDIYRYFVNRGICYVQFIPIIERDAASRPIGYSCTAEQFGRFMIEVFDQWLARDAGRVSERLIDNVLHQLVYDSSSLCCYSPRCANAHVLEFNGDLYACDHFVYRQWLIGNIMHEPLEELLLQARLAEFAALKTELPSACRDCEFLRFCNGGCPKHHMPIGMDPARTNHFCKGYKMFFRHALPGLERIAEGLKRGEFPTAGQKRPAEAVSAASALDKRRIPGRNDSCPCGSGRKFKNCCYRR